MAQSAGTPASSHGDPRMNHILRYGALALSTALLVAGCKPSGTETAGGPGTSTAPAGDQVSAQITGAGATFIYPLLSQWSGAYNKATGHKINYQPIGSGGGIAQIKAGTVDFGSSDKPLPSEELAAS